MTISAGRAGASWSMQRSDEDQRPLARVMPAFWHEGHAGSRARIIPDEVAVAFTYNQSTHAVMMASPADLEDLAVGFSLNEAIVEHPGQIEEIRAVVLEDGIDLRIRLDADRASGLIERRRHVAGPSGCGLCGIDSLAGAMRPPKTVGEGLRLTPDQVLVALDALGPHQIWGRESRAMHAAGWWHPDRGMALVREDVGRHNALDKLAGALVLGGLPAAEGVAVITSRVSIEMVQKVAMAGITVMIAVSAPTALAIRTAEAAGITLVAVARADGFEVFTGVRRIAGLDQS